MSAFDATVRLMQALAAVAMIIVGLEWQAMQQRHVLHSRWPQSVLRDGWGWRRVLVGDGIVRLVPLLQVTLASALLLAAMLDDRQDPMGAMAAAGLAATVWHTSVRIRSTMNGGSDGMLFTALLALTVVPRQARVLQATGIGVIVFELAAPVALIHPTMALIYAAAAWCFHLATAVVFGLNRFLLAWTAALPSLWFAAVMLRAAK